METDILKSRVITDPNEAEYALIGLAVLYPRSVVPMMRRKGLTHNMFRSRNAQTAADAIYRLYDRGQAIDLITVTDLIRKAQPRFFVEFDGETFLDGIMGYARSGIASADHAEDYIETVLDAALRRDLAERLQKAQVALTSATPARDCLARTQYELMSVARDRSHGEFTHLGQMLDAYFPDVERILQDPKDVVGLRTPSTNLNRMTGGIMPGEYWLVGGHPGLGKTSWLLDTALINALADDKLVFFCSAEMPAYQVLLKILAAQFRVPVSTLKTGRNDIENRNHEYVNRQIGVLMKAVKERLPEQNMHRVDNFRFLECAGMTVPELEASILFEASALEREPDLVCVDYLQILKPHTGDNQSEKIFWISEALKTVAARRRWPIHVASQLNDDGKVFGGRAPHHNAHVHFNLIKGEAGQMVLNVNKVRMGPTADLNVRFLGSYGVFEDAGEKPGNTGKKAPAAT